MERRATPSRLVYINNNGTRRRRRRTSAYSSLHSARRMTRAYSDARLESVRSDRSAIQSVRSPITWSPWSMRSDLSVRVEGKIDRNSGPVPDRASVRLPWQDVRHLRIRIYNDQLPEALRIMEDYGLSASTRLRAPDVDYHTPFELARIAKARKCLSHFLGLRTRAFIIIQKARGKYLSYIKYMNQNLIPGFDLSTSSPVGESGCLLQPRSKPKRSFLSRSCQSCASTSHAPSEWRPLPDPNPFDDCQQNCNCQRMCLPDDVALSLHVDNVDMFSYLREFVVVRSGSTTPPRGPCWHALCWMCGVWFRERLSRRAFLLIMQFYLPRVVDFPLMGTATLVPPHLWPARTGVHSEPQLPSRDNRYCASCSVS